MGGIPVAVIGNNVVIDFGSHESAMAGIERVVVLEVPPGERPPASDREFETMWAFATRWNDMADLVRLMDSKATAHVENPDGTVESYIVPASALNRVLAFANGSKSQATKRALDKFRAAAAPAPEGGESGDGAARQRKWGRRWNDGLWPVDEPRDAGIDAALLRDLEARIRGLRINDNFGGPISGATVNAHNRAIEQALAQFIPLIDLMQARSGSPAPEGDPYGGKNFDGRDFPDSMPNESAPEGGE